MPKRRQAIAYSDRRLKKDSRVMPLLMLGGIAAFAAIAMSGSPSKASTTGTPDFPPSPPKLPAKPPSTPAPTPAKRPSTPAPTPAKRPSTPATVPMSRDEELDQQEILEAVKSEFEKKDSGAEPVSPPAKTGPTSSRAQAMTLAQRLAANVRAKQYDYDRVLCRQFQIAAGKLAADGLYGGMTFNALKHYGIASPPPALFKPSPSSAKYVPPSSN